VNRLRHAETTAPVAKRALRRVSRRILPFLSVLYIISFIDRANVSFAKLAMSADLGFSEQVFGFAAGIFFVGYLLLEIPGAIIVERWSARVWLSRILISWGLCATLIGFVQSKSQFYWMRFALGLAEAGFFPGVIVYLSHWFPRAERARALAGFVLAVPISFIIGAPLSAACLSIHWLGLPGWRWIFILQGIPAVLAGIVALFYFTDHPAGARWLEPDERQWLEEKLQGERAPRVKLQFREMLAAMLAPRTLQFAISLFLTVMATYGFIFWLPATIHSRSNLTVIQSTLLSGIPFAFAAVFVWLAGRSSDKTGERRWHSAVPLILAGIGLAGSGIPGQGFVPVMMWLCFTGAWLWAWAPSFWVLPASFLEGSAAATAIGFINSTGSLGGFTGPLLVGSLLDRHWHMPATLLLLSLCFFLSGALVANAAKPGRAHQS
jgi:MFS transporter, ACS family, tartrate transporter